MSYAIVDDGDQINIRATITQRWELAELVTKLQQRIDGLPVNVTTEDRRPWSAYPETDRIEVVPCSGGTTASCTVNREGTVTVVTINAANAFDAQDVNQQELKHE
jgi:hypothetical protein